MRFLKAQRESEELRPRVTSFIEPVGKHLDGFDIVRVRAKGSQEVGFVVHGGDSRSVENPTPYCTTSEQGYQRSTNRIITPEQSARGTGWNRGSLATRVVRYSHPSKGPFLESFMDSAPIRTRWRRRFLILLMTLLTLTVLYLAVAYLLIPLGWRSYAKRHPAFKDAPQVTHTSTGIPGDPLNLGLVGTEEELQAAMLAAKWYPADPITLKSSLKIAAGTAFHRSYDDAPVSSLFLFGRKQDLAFEQPVGDDPRRRHHVRFWKAEALSDDGRPLWFGAATFDTKVGFSHTTGEVTHHISANVDAERDKIIDDLNQAGHLSDRSWEDNFHEKREGKNGGGDPYQTDGRLAVGVLSRRE